MPKKTPQENEKQPSGNAELKQQMDVYPPFSQPREALLNKFRAYSVPREADYQQLITQQEYMASAIGMNYGGTAGDGLLFSATNKKLEILLSTNEPAGLTLSPEGIGVKVKEGGAVVIEDDGLSINKDAVYPIGTIVIFHGKEEDIPKGWVICDGKNGTPNLSGRFIRGAKTVSTLGGTGGNASINIDVEGEVIIEGYALEINQLPVHYHAVNYKPTDTFHPQLTDFLGKRFPGSLNRNSVYEYNTEQTGGGKKHTHNAVFTGKSIKVSLSPPHIVLFYIMRK